MSEEQTALQTQSKGPLNVNLLGGVAPQNYAEMMQFSSLIHNSGMAPKTLDTLPKVAVALMMAYEVGLPLFTGIQHIAVINGKAAIWGDATLALVRSSGMMEDGYPVEWVEGTPYQDDWTFYCKVKRRGGPEVVGSFSWAEAKKAGFDNPKQRDGTPDRYSPWTRFPRRMMQWKARQWVYRDEFGDVLRGMRMAEEAFDTIDMEKQSNGGYTPAERFEATEKQEQGVKEIFDSVVNARVPADVAPFVAHCAKQFGKTEAEIMSDALEDPDNFIAGFTAWDSAQDRPPGEQNKAEAASSPPECADAPPEGENSPEGDFRSEWINLRGPGYSTYVWQHKERFESAPPDIRHEAADKWRKLYKEPVPVHLMVAGDEQPSPLPQPPEEKPVGITEGPEWATDDAAWTAHVDEAAEILGYEAFSEALTKFKVMRRLDNAPVPSQLRGEDRVAFHRILRSM